MQNIAAVSVTKQLDRMLLKGGSINTYEFRHHNSTLDLDILKQNILLDTVISKVAYEMVHEPEKNQKKLSKFFDKNVNEEEKADNFLELLFDNPEDRKIYKQRWEVNKNAPIFSKVKGFKKATFDKGDLKNITFKTKAKNVLNVMKRVLNQAKEFLKDESSGIYLDNIVMDYGGR